MDWLLILIDDILRLSKEKNKPISIDEIIDETSIERKEALNAINEMKRDGLIKFDKNVSLTKKGMERADRVYERHKIIEEFFGGKEAHEIAHSLEHFLKKEDIESMKSMLNKKRYNLKKFGEGEKGIIVASTIKNPKIISRLIGIGIAPASAFRIEKIRNDEIILAIHNRLVVIDSNLANKIFAIRVENEGIIDRTT